MLPLLALPPLTADLQPPTSRPLRLLLLLLLDPGPRPPPLQSLLNTLLLVQLMLELFKPLLPAQP